MSARRLGAICQKTKMCKFFRANTCMKGKECSFAHSPDELTTAPDLQRTKMCPALKRAGICNNSFCTFAHNKSELRKVVFEKAGCQRVVLPNTVTAQAPRVKGSNVDKRQGKNAGTPLIGHTISMSELLMCQTSFSRQSTCSGTLDDESLSDSGMSWDSPDKCRIAEDGKHGGPEEISSTNQSQVQSMDDAPDFTVPLRLFIKNTFITAELAELPPMQRRAQSAPGRMRAAPSGASPSQATASPSSSSRKPNSYSQAAKCARV